MADVPAPLELVESFLNSVDVETGLDDLRDVATFRRWLADHDRPAAADEHDLDLARRLRTELRAEAATHHQQPDQAEPRDRGALDALAVRIPLAVRFAPDGAAVPGPTGTGVTGVLGEVLAAVALAAHDGSWRRMKICPADDCRWVYYDASRNSSRRWCSMKVCGNRNKTRSYRQRTAPA
jgi:predicted RNA-binding Zn ribbon-like protein